LSQPLRYDYEESQRVLSNSITQNDKERAIFKQKLEALLAFDAQSPGYFSGVGESEALLNEGLTLLGGDPATGKVGAGSWNGQGFTPIVSDWQQRVNDQWTKRVERQEQARAAEFEQAAQGRTYQRVQLASGAYQWLWVKDSGKITQEDLQFNKKYADYLAILNAPEENMVDEYYQNMLEELRTGINVKTGKPLTTLEKAQRWSTVASFVAVLAIGSYYSVKGLTGTKTTAKQPKFMNKATVPKAKLPSDTTQGRQLKVKKADIPKGKSRSIVAPKKAGGANTVTKYDDVYTYKYNGYDNPGPLNEIKGQPNKNFYGGRYNVEVLTEPKILYRAGDSTNPLGQWFTEEPPSSVANVRIEMAVKEQWIDNNGVLTGTSNIDTVYKIEIPAGTTIYSGPVGNQGGIYQGGVNTNQIFINKPWELGDKIIILDSSSLK
jgi:hypothetical protein